MTIALPAHRAADSRLTEVLVHHVDLNTAYQPSDWPADFVAGFTADVITASGGRDGVPALHLFAVDTGAEYRLGGQDDALVVRAGQAELLAWLLGRTENDRPALPPLF